MNNKIDLDLHLSDIKDMQNTLGCYEAYMFEFICSAPIVNSSRGYSNIDNIQTSTCFMLKEVILQIRDIIVTTGYFKSSNNLLDLFSDNYFGIFKRSFEQRHGSFSDLSNRLMICYWGSIIDLIASNLDFAEIQYSVEIIAENEITKLICFMCGLLHKFFLSNNNIILTKLIFDCYYMLKGFFRSWESSESGKKIKKIFYAKKGKRAQNFSYEQQEEDKAKARILLIRNIIIERLNDGSYFNLSDHELTITVWRTEITGNKHANYLAQLEDRRQLTSHKSYKDIIYWVKYLRSQPLECYDYYKHLELEEQDMFKRDLEDRKAKKNYNPDDDFLRVYYRHNAEQRAEVYQNQKDETQILPHTIIIWSNEYRKVYLH